MSNEELEDDVVLAKFINYMQKALYHMRLNYFRDYERMRDYEVELEEIECPNSKDIINEVKEELKRLYSLVNTAPKKAVTAMTIKDFFKIQECKIANQKAIRILEPLI